MDKNEKDERCNIPASISDAYGQILEKTNSFGGKQEWHMPKDNLLIMSNYMQLAAAILPPLMLPQAIALALETAFRLGEMAAIEQAVKGEEG